MRYDYYLSVAGVNIRFESDCAIVENEEFRAFVTEECIPDIQVSVRMEEDMPKIPTEPLYEDMFCSVTENEKGYLQKFFRGNRNEQNRYVVSTYSPDNKHVFIVYPKSNIHEQLTLTSCFYWLGFESYLLQRDKMCLHASLLNTSLGGILFSGASGIGKSTQAELWCRHRDAKQINGDRPILSKEVNGWSAWGSPYSGSSKYHKNECCDITAIVLLKQAGHCSLRRLTTAESFRGVWAGLTIRSWDSSFVDAASRLTTDLVTTVPVYEFCCTPDEQAVEYLEAELRKEDSI